MPAILAAVFIDLLGFGLIVPILPFLTLEFGGGAFAGTALISIYSLMGFLAGPIWGRLSDKIGRRPALMMTFAGAAISYVTLAHAETILMLFIARAMSGAMAGNIGIVMAIIADITTPENRAKALGLLGATFGLGFAIGPAAGGLLGSIGGEVSIFYPAIFAAGLSAIAMILAFFFIPETNDSKLEPVESSGSESNDPTHNDEGQSTQPATTGKWHDALKGHRKIRLFAMVGILAIAQSICFSIAPFWMDTMLSWDQKQVGFLLMLVGLCVFVSQSVGTRTLFKAVGEVRAVIVASLIQISGCAYLGFTDPSYLSAVIGFPLIMSGLTLTFPAMNSIVSTRSHKKLQGTALGLANGLGSLGRVFGPLSAGTLFTATTPMAPFVIVAVIGLISILWAVGEIQNQPALSDTET